MAEIKENIRVEELTFVSNIDLTTVEIFNNLLNTTTIGMEIEVNPTRNMNLHFSGGHVVYSHDENSRISEYHLKPVKPKNVRNLVRRSVGITISMYQDGLFYDRGLNDYYAGSNHLHVYTQTEKLTDGILQKDNELAEQFIKATVMLFAPIFSRTGITFRINTDRRLQIRDYINWDGKAIALTTKEFFGPDGGLSLEFRLNENPLSMIYSYEILTIIAIFEKQLKGFELTEKEEGILEKIDELFTFHWESEEPHKWFFRILEDKERIEQWTQVLLEIIDLTTEFGRNSDISSKRWFSILQTIKIQHVLELRRLMLNFKDYLEIQHGDFRFKKGKSLVKMRNPHWRWLFNNLINWLELDKDRFFRQKYLGLNT